MNLSRRKVLSLAGASALGASALAAPAIASQKIEWRMVTAWPKNLPGPGMMARRICERVEALSDGRFTIKLFAAGELAPAFGVLDAVASNVAEIGHATAFYWFGKVPEAVYFTAVPFGLTALDHTAWVEQGGGQALWDKVYAPLGVKAFMAGNIGMSMAGWFHREINTLEDFKGLTIRSPGLGGEVYKRLGATAVTLPSAELFLNLSNKQVDAVEFLGPWNDTGLGLDKAGAKYYYGPGVMKPNGPSEAVVSLKALEALPQDLREILIHAISVENHFAHGEAEGQNLNAVKALEANPDVSIRAFSQDLLAEMKKVALDVVRDHASTSALAAEIDASYQDVLSKVAAWNKYGYGSYYAL